MTLLERPPTEPHQGAGREPGPTPSPAAASAPQAPQTTRSGSFGLQSLALAACALMAFSGSLKEVVPFSLIPGDLTLITTLAAFGLAAMFSVLHGSFRVDRPVWVFVFLLGVAVAGSVSYVATEYAQTKYARLFIVTLAAALTVVLAVRDHHDTWRLLRLMLVVAAFHAAWINIGGERQFEGIGRLVTTDGTTISFGRAAGFVVVACAAWVISSRSITPTRLAVVGGIAAFHIWTLFAIAAKGPALGFMLALAAMVLLQLRRVAIRTAVRLLALFSALGLAVSMVWTRIPASSRERFINVSDSGSVGVREEAFAWTWAEVSASPFGHGWGSWDIESPVKIEYPHNLLLEVWYEAGVVGLLAMLAALWLAFRHQDRVFSADRFKATLMLGTLVFWLTAGLVSGQINDNKVLFVLLVAAAAPVASEAVGRSSHPGPVLDLAPRPPPAEAAPAQTGTEPVEP